MTPQPSAEASTPGAPPRGIFLPSMVWTTDREVVTAEKKRLLALHKRLCALVFSASGAQECAAWLMMAEESLDRLDQDIDDLYDWLADAKRTARRAKLDKVRD